MYAGAMLHVFQGATTVHLPSCSDMCCVLWCRLGRCGRQQWRQCAICTQALRMYRPCVTSRYASTASNCTMLHHHNNSNTLKCHHEICKPVLFPTARLTLISAPCCTCGLVHVCIFGFPHMARTAVGGFLDNSAASHG